MEDIGRSGRFLMPLWSGTGRDRLAGRRAASDGQTGWSDRSTGPLAVRTPRLELESLFVYPDNIWAFSFLPLAARSCAREHGRDGVMSGRAHARDVFRLAARASVIRWHFEPQWWTRPRAGRRTCPSSRA